MVKTIDTATVAMGGMFLMLMPEELKQPALAPAAMWAFRMLAGFTGVCGFSILFNSTPRMAVTAGAVGMLANTFRLFLTERMAVPFSIAAFLGAMTAGLMSFYLKRRLGIPRISLTVPSVVIMVPGMFMYRGVYHMSTMNLVEGGEWIVKALLIVAALPLGLVAARILTDPSFRHST